MLPWRCFRSVVGDGFRMRQGCEAIRAFVAGNLETSGTIIRRLEISRGSATIRAHDLPAFGKANLQRLHVVITHVRLQIVANFLRG